MNKSAKRRAKKTRMAKMYREFFADPKNQADIDKHHVEYLVDLHPRLCRDIVLGYRSRESGRINHEC